MQIPSIVKIRLERLATEIQESDTPCAGLTFEALTERKATEPRWLYRAGQLLSPPQFEQFRNAIHADFPAEPTRAQECAALHAAASGAVTMLSNHIETL